MAAIDWPTTLPAPLQDGYGETPPDTSLRTEMDSGPAKVRRRYTAGPRRFSLRFHFTKEEIATFDTFWLTTAKSGSLRFDFTHPRTGDSCEARFLGPPKYSAVDHEGEVAVDVEILP